LADFRAVRHKLESHEFAISEGEDVAPTQLIDKKTWAGITHLSDDVAIRMATTVLVAVSITETVPSNPFASRAQNSKQDSLIEHVTEDV
jgi:hypothetical protein